MVNFYSKAVRPSLNATSQEEVHGNGLSHDGETEHESAQESVPSRGRSSSSTDKHIRQSTNGEQGGHEAEDVEDEEEEAREPVTRKAPKGPTKEEREKHDATHLQFREWCDHCVRGRGRNNPHKKKQEEDEETETKVVRISMDYFFMS